MADTRYRLRAGDPDFGRTCPVCASPKSKQARRCRACYRDDQLTGRVRVVTPRLFGAANPNWRGGRKRRRGGSTGRPQPQTHPWRAKNALLFQRRAA